MKFLNKSISIIITLSLFLFTLSSFDLNSFAESVENNIPRAGFDSEAKETIEAIEKVDPQNPDKIDLKVKKGQIISEQGDLINEFDLEEKTISGIKNLLRILIGLCGISTPVMLITQKVQKHLGIWNHQNLIKAIGDLYQKPVINNYEKRNTTTWVHSFNRYFIHLNISFFRHIG